MYFLPEQVNEYDRERMQVRARSSSYQLFVSDEKTAIQWVRRQLAGEGRLTYQDLQPDTYMKMKPS